MSKLLVRELIAEQARIVAPPRPAHVVDRSFELPRGLYVATVAFYLGFLAVLAAGLATPGLLIPMTIFTLFIVVGFGLPALWVRLAPASGQKPLDWTALKRRGIVTHTGRVTARDAAIQVLILPALVFCWGVAAVTVAALVR